MPSSSSSKTVGAGDAQPRPGSPGFDGNAAPYAQQHDPTQQQHNPTLHTTPQPTLTQHHTTFGEPAPLQPLGTPLGTPHRLSMTTAVPASADTTHVLQSPQGPGAFVQVSPPTAQGARQAQVQQATLEANFAQAAAQVSLQDTIAALTTTIASLNERLKSMEDENKHLQTLIRENTKQADTRAPFLPPQQPSPAAAARTAYPRRSQHDDLADIDRKDVEKPPKYGGNLAQWRLWFTKFRGFLARRDPRWGDLLDALKADSKDPLTDQSEVKLFSKINVDSEELSTKFKGQLYEYLETFTEGMAHATVVTGGSPNVLEVLRQLCDEGFSVRERHLRQEYRKVIHPKQASFDSLKKAILTWETELAQYQLAAGYEMKEKDRIMCLEDMCPDILQQHLDSKEHLETYPEYKTAINDYLVNRQRWMGSGRGRLNWLGVPEFDTDSTVDNFSNNQCPDDHDHNHDHDPESVNECINSLTGEIMALVKGKMQRKGKGKGKSSGGATTAPTSASTSDVIMTDKVCYECDKPGHLARDCPQRQARVAAGGPARLPKGGKGKGKGKDGGKAGQAGGKGWPTRQWWNGAYPGPSQQQWRSWYPQQGQANGRVNLFQPPFQLSPIAPQGGP